MRNDIVHFNQIRFITANTECSEEQLSTCNGGDSSTATCAVTNGYVLCVCAAGYALDSDNNCVVLIYLKVFE